MTSAPQAARPAPTLGFAILLASLSMVSPLSIDTFFPSFRAIADEFALEPWQVQQTITFYLLPYAVMSLFHGPLSDAVGRRPVLAWGLGLYTLASVAAAFAPSFGALLALRALQGATVGAGVAVSRAVVRDLYDGPEAQRLMTTMMSIFGLAPAVAPVIGGWIHVFAGWRATFAFMALVGIVVYVASRARLPETHPVEKRIEFHPVVLSRASFAVARHREFVLLAIGGSFIYGALMTYVGSAPMIVLDRWHLSETQFFWLFGPLIGGLMSGGFLTGRLSSRVSRGQLLRFGYVTSIVATLLQMILQLSVDAVPIAIQQALLFVTGFGMQFVVPLLQLRMLDFFPHTRGSAASMQVFIQLMFTAIAMGVVAPALGGSLPAIAIVAFGSTLVGLLISRAAWRAS